LSASNHFTLPVGTSQSSSRHRWESSGYPPDGDRERVARPGFGPPPTLVAVPDQRAQDRLSARLVVAGGLVFVAGLLALGVALAVWARHGSAPGGAAALALLCPVGFAIAFAGLVVQARAGRR
jgi:hypothetical protein